MEQIKKKVAVEPKSQPKPAVQQTEEPKPAKAEESAVVQFVTIRIPVEMKPVPSFRLHADIGFTGDSTEAIRMAAGGLDHERITLSNGRRCVGTNDVLRYIVEQISAELKKLGKPV